VKSVCRNVYLALSVVGRRSRIVVVDGDHVTPRRPAWCVAGRVHQLTAGMRSRSTAASRYNRQPADANSAAKTRCISAAEFSDVFFWWTLFHNIHSSEHCLYPFLPPTCLTDLEKRGVIFRYPVINYMYILHTRYILCKLTKLFLVQHHFGGLSLYAKLA